MQFEDVTKISNAAISKKELLNNHPGKYLIRAVMAGFFVSINMILCNVSGNVFASDSPAWGKLIGATFWYCSTFRLSWLVASYSPVITLSWHLEHMIRKYPGDKYVRSACQLLW